MATRPGAGQSAAGEYRRRLRSWRTASRRRFLRGLPAVLLLAGALDWWIARHTPGAPLYGHAAALAVLLAWTGTFATPQHVRAWRSGAEGERRTSRTLRPLSRRGAVILHDRAIGRSANLDHIAVGRWGIAYIDTKNWQAKGARVVLSRDGATLWYGTYAQNRTVSTVHWEVRQMTAALRRQLDDLQLDIQPIIAVQGAPVGRRGILTFDGIVIVEAPRLARHLRRRRRILTPDQITRLGTAAERAFPPKT
ncbi:nuclease-related domain-containing protein [Streptomyces erythrochromogenes]|uniref:nuclease-related domain-containing protein n=1 Tax=Streptomyces erythrochromogenes TaxID=285574 RepID=UPI0037002FF1